MEKENILIIMVTHMKDNLFMVKKKEKVFINVITYMNMMVIGILIYLAVLENYLTGIKVELLKVLGDMAILWKILFMKKEVTNALKILI